jgi:thymidylate kinase
MAVTIYITGPVGSGKTTVAPIIRKALRDAGLEVVDETEPPEAWHVDGHTLAAIRSTPVTLREGYSLPTPDGTFLLRSKKR